MLLLLSFLSLSLVSSTGINNNIVFIINVVSISIIILMNNCIIISTTICVYHYHHCVYNYRTVEYKFSCSHVRYIPVYGLCTSTSPFWLPNSRGSSQVIVWVLFLFWHRLFQVHPLNSNPLKKAVSKHRSVGFSVVGFLVWMIYKICIVVFQEHFESSYFAITMPEVYEYIYIYRGMFFRQLPARDGLFRWPL